LGILSQSLWLQLHRDIFQSRNLSSAAKLVYMLHALIFQAPKKYIVFVDLFNLRWL
jgi:hypothetical protein